MIASRRDRQGSCGRRGTQVLELLFTLPLVMLLLVASLEFAGASMRRGALEHAATVGAREAGKGGDLGDVVAAVNEVLETHGITVNDAWASGTKVVLEDGLGPVAEYGDPNLSWRPSSKVPPGEVRVSVWIDRRATEVGGNAPALSSLNLLGPVGQGLCLSSSVKTERARSLEPDVGSRTSAARTAVDGGTTGRRPGP